MIKRICIFGPESTGKSTLARNIAAHYRTVCVPEFAQAYIEERDGRIGPDDMLAIADGQILSEDQLAAKANKLLVCDTDVLTTCIWSEWLFKTCPDVLYEQALSRPYDLYLLLDVDVPWVEAVYRYLPEERVSFFNFCKEKLDRLDCNYVIINGNWDQRFRQAVTAINGIL